jgi:hypothetical protein
LNKKVFESQVLRMSSHGGDDWQQGFPANNPPQSNITNQSQDDTGLLDFDDDDNQSLVDRKCPSFLLK